MLITKRSERHGVITREGGKRVVIKKPTERPNIQKWGRRELAGEKEEEGERKQMQKNTFIQKS